mmetsp:Transcript_64/g.185  ORF Transcript_64/g.185 Transcript_64/m.185 type:complete len:85 (-) Transcript_64:209-463(-)
MKEFPCYTPSGLLGKKKGEKSCRLLLVPPQGDAIVLHSGAQVVEVGGECVEIIQRGSKAFIGTKKFVNGDVLQVGGVELTLLKQ